MLNHSYSMEFWSLKMMQKRYSNLDEKLNNQFESYKVKKLILLEVQDFVLKFKISEN